MNNPQGEGLGGPLGEDDEAGQEGEQGVEEAVARDGLGPGFDGGEVRQETEVRHGEGGRFGVVGITAGGGGKVHGAEFATSAAGRQQKLPKIGKITTY